MNYRSIITASYRPCVRNLRVTVDEVLTRISSGIREEQILFEYPGLTLDDIRACVEFASALNEQRSFFSEFLEISPNDRREDGTHGAGLTEAEYSLLRENLVEPERRVPCPKCGKSVFKKKRLTDDERSQKFPYQCFWCGPINLEGFLVITETESQ